MEAPDESQRGVRRKDLYRVAVYHGLAMSDHADADAERGTERSRPTEPSGAETVEAYETDDGVVLYDAENPLAWLQASDSARIDDVR